MTDKLRGRTVGAASKVLFLNVYQTNGCPLNPGDQRLYIRYSPCVWARAPRPLGVWWFLGFIGSVSLVFPVEDLERSQDLLKLRLKRLFDKPTPLSHKACDSFT